MKTICIVNYGLGNIKSIFDAFSKFHNNIIVSKNKKDIANADVIILPGVGAFSKGMELLNKLKISNSIEKHVSQNKPFLGVCLGMQMLYEKSDEFGNCAGLSILKGEVKKLKYDINLKLPNIGWRNLSNLNKKSNNLLDNISLKNEFYFLHSFYCKPKESSTIIAKSNYGKKEFASIVIKKNIFGCQFHPEKSGESGLNIIKNFINIINQY
jgi:imidazole glycerol phosphate synthase, glutamine amidotransferase subunit